MPRCKGSNYNVYFNTMGTQFAMKFILHFPSTALDTPWFVSSTTHLHPTDTLSHRRGISSSVKRQICSPVLSKLNSFLWQLENCDDMLWFGLLINLRFVIFQIITFWIYFKTAYCTWTKTIGFSKLFSSVFVFY